MTKQLSETDVKARVKELRNFYVDLTLYGAVNLGLILIWAVSGGGYFWPIWVIVGWGIGMVLKAISLDMIPALADLFPFFDKTWEEQQIKRLLKEDSNRQGNVSSIANVLAKSPSSKAISQETAPAKKAKGSSKKSAKKVQPVKK